MPVGRKPKTPAVPESSPPSFLPEKDKAHSMGFEKKPGTDVIAPDTVTPCLYEISYIWLKNNLAFWAKPIAVDKKFITCWRWNGSKWNLSHIQLNSVDCFLCRWF